MLIIYTGLGKGKTSAAIGAAIRSTGWKKKVVIVQFIKEESWASGERAVLRSLGVDLFVMGKSWVGIMGDKKEKVIHINAAKAAVEKVLDLFKQGSYDLIICDEILGALYGNLIRKTDINKILKSYLLNPNSDLIFTGRNAPDWLIKKADLVTEMVKVKHPYDKGIIAKKGIDY